MVTCLTMSEDTHGAHAAMTMDEIEEFTDDDVKSAASSMDVDNPQEEYIPSEDDELQSETEETDEIVIEDMKKLEKCPNIHGKFRLINRIGEGTFSTVYKAEDLLCDRYGDDWAEHNARSASKIRCLARSQQLDPQTIEGKVKRSPRYVALKKIYVTSSPSRILNELEILYDLQGCASVCQIVTAFRFSDQVIVVLQYTAHVDFRLLYRKFYVEDMRHYLRSLLTALDAVHRKGIVHRDIKPTNFLYNPRIKRGVLVDFGLAEHEGQGSEPCLCVAEDLGSALKRYEVADYLRKKPTSNTTGYPKNDSRPSRRANRAGTRGFRAPEVLFKCTQQTTKIDIWSVGVILLTMVGRRFPFFHSLDDADALIEMASIFGQRRMQKAASLHGQIFETTIPTIGTKGYTLERIVQWSSCVEELSGREKQAVRLLSCLLELDPSRRCTAEEALRHDFFVKPEGDDLPWCDTDENVEVVVDAHDETAFEVAEEVQLV